MELASCAFGQSSKISYLQMITAVSAVVNGGRLMQPYLVKQIRDVNGKVLSTTRPMVKRQVIRPETSALMRELMEQVVVKGGGKNAAVAGYRIGGKSGTSQKLDSENEKARIASFVGVAPIDDPRLAVLVCLDEPHSWSSAGGSLSAPVVAKVLEESLEYLGYPRAYTPEEAARQLVTIPDLTSRRAEGAKQELKDSGLNARVVGEGERVLSQYPYPGDSLPRGSTVVLYTREQTMNTTLVPDITGLSPEEARQALQNAGLNMRAGGPVDEEGVFAESFRSQIGKKLPAGALVDVDFLTAVEEE